MPDGPCRLGIDVVRVRIARMYERTIANAVPCLESGLGCVDADRLCADPHPTVSTSHDLFLHLLVVGGSFDLPGHVEPFDDDHTVESRSVSGTPHEQPDFVRCGGGTCQRPAAIHAPRARFDERCGRAGHEPLFLDVTCRRVGITPPPKGLTTTATGDGRRDRWAGGVWPRT